MTCSEVITKITKYDFLMRILLISILQSLFIKTLSNEKPDCSFEVPTCIITVHRKR